MTAATATHHLVAPRAPGTTKRGSRLHVDHVVAAGALTLLTLATAIGMCRVFADWQFLRQLVITVIAMHAISLALRALRVPVYLALPIVMALLYETIALLFYRDTMAAIVPTGRTLASLRLDLRLVWEQFPAAVAPVPSEGSYLVAAALGVGLAAILADAFAFRAFGRAEAVVPAGVLFIFTAALGTDRDRVTVTALWLGAAVMSIALLRALHGRTDDAWLGRRSRTFGAAIPATAFCAVVAALVAAAIGPQIPGAGSEALLDTRHRKGDVTEVLSPLVSIRGRLVNRSNTEMMTVAASDGVGRYWRAAGLTVYDGEEWGLPNRPLTNLDGPIPPQSPPLQTAEQLFTISRSDGKLIPAGFPTLSLDSLTDPGSVLYEPESGTLLTSNDQLDKGDAYRVLTDVTVPDLGALRSATSTPPTPDLVALPDDFPSDVADLANDILVQAGATTPYEKAKALQDYFLQNYTYDLTLQAGHGEDAIVAFITYKRGYCEQFAGTFAAMARAVGLASRVAVGYTQGELKDDGLFHVYGRHAHAWSEIWFDGLGWVPFDATPGRGIPGAESYTGQPASQDETAGQTGTPSGPPASGPASTLAPTVTTIAKDLDGPATGSTVVPTLPPGAAGGGSSGGSGSGRWVALVLLAAIAWIVLMPVAIRRFTRRGRTPAARIIDAWHGTVGSLTLAGAPQPGGSTPMEYASVVEHHLDVDHRSLTELARFVTRAVYSPGGVGEPAALRAAVLQTQIDAGARDITRWTIRLKTRIDPRLARQRLVGDAGRSRLG